MSLIRFAARPPRLSPPEKKLSFYIVFHRDVLPENTREYSLSEIRDRFVWVAVNDTIPKSIPREFPCIEERSFPKYVPALQANHYYQNSVFFHLYWNPSFLTSEYVGFGQYDMEFKKDEFEQTLALLDKPDRVISFMPNPFVGCPQVYGFETWVNMFLQPYNAFRFKNHRFKDLEKYPLCLYHTFIIPRWLFVEMMEFVDWNMPNLRIQTNGDTRHIAGTLERVFAFYISCVLHEKRVEFHEGKGLFHRHEQRTSDALRGIVGRH
jgi:hypothetical protein